MTRPDKLTPQQARVAMMVAAHMTDKQIATALDIGVRTVRFHVRRIAVAWQLDREKVTRTQIAEKVPKTAA